MFQLPLAQMIVLIAVVVTYVAAAAMGVLQLLAGGERFKPLLPPLVLLAVVLEAVMLAQRAVIVRAVPLTGVFESMIALTLVLGLMYLLFGSAVRQVWFGSAAVWVILVIVILACSVAEPAAELHAAAATPWAIAHAIAMIFGGAAITLATAVALVYLLARRKLKHKKVMQVLGKVPNLEMLERLNLSGVRASFVSLTLGLVSGIALAIAKSPALEIRMTEWLADAKTVLIVVVWLLLAAVLAFRRLAPLSAKTTARVTILSFALILFGLVGTSAFCGSRHDFTGTAVGAVEPGQ